MIDPDVPDGGHYEGMEGVRSYMSTFLDPWESLTIAAESFEEIGDTVLVKVRQTGTGRTSGPRSCSSTSSYGRSGAPGSFGSR